MSIHSSRNDGEFQHGETVNTNVVRIIWRKPIKPKTRAYNYAENGVPQAWEGADDDLTDDGDDGWDSFDNDAGDGPEPNDDVEVPAEPAASNGKPTASEPKPPKLVPKKSAAKNSTAATLNLPLAMPVPTPQGSSDSSGLEELEWSDLGYDEDGQLAERAREMAEFLRIVGDGQPFEIRLLKANRQYGKPFTVSGYWQDPEAAAEEIIRADGEYDPAGTYVTLNRINPAILSRAAHRLEVHPETTTGDPDIMRRTLLLLDFDPVRPRDISSTDEELAEAESRAGQVRAWLSTKQGWPEPAAELSSGNGWHLLYKIELPNDEESAKLVSNLLLALSQKFGDKVVDIDKSVFNAGRITKVAGTWARKGDDTEERPWRCATLVAKAETPVVVPRERLEAVAALAAEQTPPGKQAASRQSQRAGGVETQRRLLVEKYLDHYGVEYEQLDQPGGGSRVRFALTKCPFHDDHGGKDTVIFQGEDGKLGFKCLHNRCSEKHWQDVKEIIGPPLPEHYDPPFDANAMCPASELDPRDVVQAFLRDREVDGVSTLAFWQGSFYEWGDGQYQELAGEETSGLLVRHLNEVSNKLNTSIVSNHLQQLKAQTLVPGRIQPPDWLRKPPCDWPAEEIVATRSRIIHLPSFVDGQQFSIEATPAYFTFNALNCEFSRDVPKPTGWLNFLQQLWPNDPEAIEALQDWFGYCLTPDTRQQKMLLLVGPKRSGKGTIARILRALLGKRNVAGPTLASLGTNFGLSPLLPATLAIISDARLSGKNDQAVITERLLTITGEDALTIDAKYKDPVTCKLNTRLMILTNELPKLSDSSGALAGRMILLRLTNSFFGHEDTQLTPKLLAELPGILAWAIEGWARLRERGRLIQPKGSEELVQELNDLTSPISIFVRENCIVAPEQAVAIDSLYKVWCFWCKRTGRDFPGNAQSFGRDLRTVVPALTTTQPRDGKERRRTYQGIGLHREADACLRFNPSE